MTVVTVVTVVTVMTVVTVVTVTLAGVPDNDLDDLTMGISL